MCSHNHGNQGSLPRHLEDSVSDIKKKYFSKCLIDVFAELKAA